MKATVWISTSLLLVFVAATFMPKECAAQSNAVVMSRPAGKKGHLREPDPPVVDAALNADQEASTEQLAARSESDAFETLTEDRFVVEDAYLNKAVFRAYKQRQGQGVALAVEHLKRRAPGAKKRFHVARKVFEVFPDAASETLPALYNTADVTTKANIIRVSGKIADERIRTLLVSALNDRTPLDEEEENPELADFPPLRLCDLAYNQLVLRYRVRGPLRAIGVVHRVAARDANIEILKGKLSVPETLYHATGDE